MTRESEMMWGVGRRDWSRCWVHSGSPDRMPSRHRAPGMGNFDESSMFCLQRRWSVDLWHLRWDPLLTVQEPTYVGTCGRTQSFSGSVIFRSLILVLQVQRLFGCLRHSGTTSPVPGCSRRKVRRSAQSSQYSSQFQWSHWRSCQFFRSVKSTAKRCCRVQSRVAQFGAAFAGISGRWCSDVADDFMWFQCARRINMSPAVLGSDPALKAWHRWMPSLMVSGASEDLVWIEAGCPNVEVHHFAGSKSLESWRSNHVQS